MNDPIDLLPASDESKHVEEVAAIALALSAVNESVAQTCRKLDDLHLELQKRKNSSN